MQSIVDTLRGHRSDSQGAAGNVLLPIDSSGILLPPVFAVEDKLHQRPFTTCLFLWASALPLPVS